MEYYIRKKGGIIMSISSFESLKSGFIQYLEKNQEKNNNKKYNTENDEASIFLYSKEFKNYLIDEVGCDRSIEMMNISDIMRMQIVDGKLVEADSKEAQNADKPEESKSLIELNIEAKKLEQAAQQEGAEGIENVEGTEGSEGINGVEGAEGIEGTENVQGTATTDGNEGNIELSEGEDNELGELEEVVSSDQINEYLNENEIGMSEEDFEIFADAFNILLSDEEFFNVVKGDADEIGKEQIDAFLNIVKEYDEDGKNLSLEDLLRAANDIQEGVFQLEQNAKKGIFADEIKPEENIAPSDYSAKAVVQNDKAPTGYSYGSYGNENTGKTSSPSYAQGNSNAPMANNAYNSAQNTDNSQQEPNIKNMSLDELNKELEKANTKLDENKNGLSEIQNGDNEELKGLTEAEEKAEERYEELSNQIDVELKERLDEAKDNFANAKDELLENQAEIKSQETEVSNCESNLANATNTVNTLEARKAQLESLNEEGKYNEQIAALSQEIEAAKEKETKAKEALDEAKNKLSELKEKEETLKENLDNAQTALDDIKEEIQQTEPEVAEALQNWEDAKNTTVAKKEELMGIQQEKIKEQQSYVNEIEQEISTKKDEEVLAKSNTYEFDFTVKDNDIVNYNLNAFMKIWDENKERYQALSERLGGFPAELIAAIHFRESACNFDTYLHNGDPLGKTTTHVPAGIYFDNWEDAAYDAISRSGTGVDAVDVNDISTWYEYAEAYNGYGYSKYHNMETPYVWSGTDRYESGLYVADGKFSDTAVDKSIGVAVMLKALLG